MAPGHKYLSNVMLIYRKYTVHPKCDSRGYFHMNTSSYRYRNSHYKDKTVSRPSYLYNGIPIHDKDCLNIETEIGRPSCCRCTFLVSHWGCGFSLYCLNPNTSRRMPFVFAGICLCLRKAVFLSYAPDNKRGTPAAPLTDIPIVQPRTLGEIPSRHKKVRWLWA